MELCPIWANAKNVKCQTRISSSFRYKYHIPKDFISGVVYKFEFGLCNESYYGESIRHINIRPEEHIGLSPLTGKKVKPSNNSASCDHLLHCDFSPSFDKFSILARENETYLSEIKESLLIMRDKLSLNKNINFAPLYLFDEVSYQVLVYFTLVYLTYLVYFLLNVIIKFQRRSNMTW